MERISLRALVVALVVLIGGAATAEPPPARNLAKTRPGSFLKKEKAWDEPVDLRGEAERRRDKELVVHYRRMAELDAIAMVAQKGGDVTLQERVEDVRRKELERHHRIMMRLRREMAAAVLAGSSR